MKHDRSWRLLRTLFLGVGAVGSGAVLLTHYLVFAASGQLYFSPGAAKVIKGKNIALTLRINPGATVDGVSASVTFDATKLQYVSADFGSSAFPIQLVQSVASGTISIERGNLSGGVGKDAVVGVLTFRALTDTGSSTVGVSGNASNGGSYTDPAGGSATITFSPVPSTGGGTGGGGSGDPGGSPGPGGSGSDSGSGSTSGSGSGTSTPGTGSTGTGTGGSSAPSGSSHRQPKLTIGLGDLEFNKARIRIRSDMPVRVWIQYGIDGKLNLVTGKTGLGASQDVQLDSRYLIPGTTYAYRVMAQASDGTTIAGAKMSFKTKGYVLKIKVLDKNMKPLRKRSVTLHSEPITTRTDDAGLAVFNDVAPGTHRVEYMDAGKIHSSTVAVDNSMTVEASGKQSAMPQNTTVMYTDLAVTEFPTTKVTALVSAVALLGVGLFVVRAVRSNKPAWQSSPGFASNEVTTDESMKIAEAVDPVFRAKGLDTPNPGAVVTPQRDDGPDGQNNLQRSVR